MTLTTLGYAFLGGLLPSFIWLYFLLQEDARHPEPKAMIALAFIAGMVAVPLALPLEQYAKVSLGSDIDILTAWALIEEFLKYGMAALFILWRPAVDEAPDYVIYMITIALGFAAAENMLFLIAPISDGSIASGIFTGNVRFIGSTMLHVLASASIGFMLAFSHTAFNALIITQGTSTTLSAVFLVWTGAVIFFAAFEVLKYFQYRTIPINTP